MPQPHLDLRPCASSVRPSGKWEEDFFLIFPSPSFASLMGAVDEAAKARPEKEEGPRETVLCGVAAAWGAGKGLRVRGW